MPHVGIPQFAAPDEAGRAAAVDAASRKYRRCTSKVRFRTNEKASARAQRLGMRAYRCHECGGWHLTSRV